ncbi:acetate--CoA ligase family protein [Allopusillimonas ginsengisoli]|uniref:acetate--CoA ligase family protein n=1 Tax=Allopusillimonas ginsengisoli TaxID=453575 RepID=UPI0039C1BEEB
MTLLNLNSFLAPRSIAVVGASATPQKIGAVPVRYLMENGYSGRIYPINHHADEISGLPAYKTLTAVGSPIDLAIFAIPAHHAETALDDAIVAGVKNIVMFSGGFAETGEPGEQAQQSFLKKARAAGIRVLGPNCLGFMNFSQSIYATFSPVVATGLVKPGKIGVVCQSGAFGAYAYALARERDVGLSVWITTGNEGDISVADCIAWMATDPQTEIIMAYMEGCTDGLRLRRALERARLAGKPVIVVKVGRTELGALTAASHTAALAGDDAVYETLFRQHGAWRARTIEEFFDVAHCLAVSGVPENGRVGILTVSGGVGVMMADDAADAGLDVSELPAPAQQRIKSRVPLAATHNPVDLTGTVTAEPELLDFVARIMLGEAGHGSLLIFLSAFGINQDMRLKQRQLAKDLRLEFPNRVIIFSTLADREQQHALAELGCLCFDDPARAIRVLAAMNFFQTMSTITAEVEQKAPLRSQLCRKAYNEFDAIEVLRSAGISFVGARIAKNKKEAIDCAEAIGFPVVMKVLSAHITHKSDIGGVVVNIQDTTQAGAAFDRITKSLECSNLTHLSEGILIAPMVKGGVECILGVKQDPNFGAVIMLGSGGVDVELMGDIALRLAPVSLDQAREMITELKTAPLLNGFRGALKADTAELASSIVALSEFAMSSGKALSSAEINPFLVLPEGQGAIGLDAVLLTTEEDDPGEYADWIVQTLPLFEMARMRAANTARKHTSLGFAGDSPASSMRWVNQFTHTRRLRGPEDKEVVTPNNDTLFTNAWLDLSEHPLVIDVPEMGERYWVLGFLDAWTNPWAYAGRRTTGGARQQLFVYGPGWRGDVPAGMHPIKAPGDDVWLIGRILVDPCEEDLARVHALQNQFSISRLDGSCAVSRIDTLFTEQDAGVPSVDEYLRVLNIMLARNPSALDLAATPASAASLQRALEQVYSDLREVAAPSELGGGWTQAVHVRTSFGNDIFTRARVARNWIGTLGIDEAMYIMAEVDEKGDSLIGTRSYVLRFPPEHAPQVGAFWSITLYRRSDCLLVANPIGRHSIGDRTPGLMRDEDGGLTLSIQADDPGGDKNWLPTPTHGEFYLTLRLYQPQQAHLESTFRYPPVQQVRCKVFAD